MARQQTRAVWIGPRDCRGTINVVTALAYLEVDTIKKASLSCGCVFIVRVTRVPLEDNRRVQ